MPWTSINVKKEHRAQWMRASNKIVELTFMAASDDNDKDHD